MRCHSASVRSEVYRIRRVLRGYVYIVHTKMLILLLLFSVFKQALSAKTQRCNGAESTELTICNLQFAISGFEPWRLRAFALKSSCLIEGMRLPAPAPITRGEIGRA